jgi:hypothetical protein
MSWKSKIQSFFEWVPLGSAGTIVAIISLLSREVEFVYRGYDIPFLIAVLLVSILVIFLIGKRIIPSIHVFTKGDHNNLIKLEDIESLDASNGDAEIDLVFKVPDHHNCIYISIEIEEYEVGIEQYTPVHNHGDEAVTYHSNIDKFELTLRLVPNSNEAHQGSELPLEIIDKLHNKALCEVPVEG